MIVSKPPPEASPGTVPRADRTAVDILEVVVPSAEDLNAYDLKVREAGSGKLVTKVELLSPANRLHRMGRAKYVKKREDVFLSATNFVEIDLLRAGRPMPLGIGRSVQSHYRLLMSPAARRLRAHLKLFDVRQPIPTFDLPLDPGDHEPELDLGAILHARYDRAHYELRIDYTQPPVPPLNESDAAWAREIIQAAGWFHLRCREGSSMRIDDSALTSSGTEDTGLAASDGQSGLMLVLRLIE
jgi:hypothetical protein